MNHQVCDSNSSRSVMNSRQTLKPRECLTYSATFVSQFGMRTRVILPEVAIVRCAYGGMKTTLENWIDSCDRSQLGEGHP
jgi:hypothetical protein